MTSEGAEQTVEPMDEARSMKPLLGKLIEEAVHLALIDSCLAIEQDRRLPSSGSWTLVEHQAVTERIKADWHDDIYAIPGECLAGMDAVALAQNVAVRLLGPGGWMVGGVYAGNATARELSDVTFGRPDRSHTSEVAFDMLGAMEQASELRVDDESDPA